MRLPFTRKKADVTFNQPPVFIPDGVPLPSTDPRIALLFQYGGVSREKAMQIPAVAHGMHTLTNLANLKLETFDVDYQTRLNPLIDQIDLTLPNVITMTRTIEDLVFNGVALWEVTERRNGYPVHARYVSPHRYRIRTQELSNGDIQYSYVLYGQKVVNNNDVIRIDSPRDALLPLMSSAIRQAIALQLTAEGFAKNPVPKMVVTSRGDTAPAREEIVSNLQAFKEERADNPIGYLGPDLELKEIQLLSPQELQLIESDKSTILAIANFFDMDPDQVGLSTGDSNTYNNAVDRRIDRRNNQLQWVAQGIEQRLSMPDITPIGFTVRFDFDDLLRVEPKTRAEIAQIEMTMGATTVAEYRRDTGRAPLTMDQQMETMLHVPSPAQAVQASRRESVNFDADESLELDFDDLKFARDINPNRRTVTVLAVPYGQSAKSGGGKWEFTKGSLEYADISRVKLLRDHDSTISVGIATKAEDTDAGMVITFKVAPGPAGDKALADFANKTHDGVSIGLDPENLDYVKHPTKPGVNLVHRAILREVSQVALPSFDDSRVISVQMSRDTSDLIKGDIQMTDEIKNETPDVGKLVAEAVALAFATQTANNKKETPIQDEAPALEVKNEKENDSVTTFVNEEPLYRFSDNSGKYDFSADIKAALMSGDQEAKNRVNSFLKDEFALKNTAKRTENLKFANLSVANAAAINPNIQRPDMYVDKLSYQYPIWTSINKGDVPNGVTTFTVPKWNSSTTLIAAHTEGNEPTAGGFTVVGQNITPTAMSGKVTVNREAFDQMGNPALSGLLYAEMTRAYFELLETGAATFLNGLTLTGNEFALTDGDDDDTLVDSLTQSLIGLQFARGGYRLDNFVSEGNLYSRLAVAKDADNRHLLSAVNPANAIGSAQVRWVGLDINGIVARPTWSLGAVALTTDANVNSYIYASEDVSGWATAPELETFRYQVSSLDFTIFAYRAYANTRVDGVRRVKYNPVA